MRPRARVVVFPGSNGERDLYEAFARAGFDAAYQESSEPIPEGIAVVGLPGGFSFGDHWRAGVLASLEPAVRSLGEHVARGGFAIGICNGFQTLIEGGYLPGALLANEAGRFIHRDEGVSCEVDASPWLRNMPDTLRLPISHGEGRYVRCSSELRVALRYQHNPNGADENIAGICDATGRILGLMPHPERVSDPRLGPAPGLALFEGVFAAAQEGAV